MRVAVRVRATQLAWTAARHLPAVQAMLGNAAGTDAAVAATGTAPRLGQRTVSDDTSAPAATATATTTATAADAAGATRRAGRRTGGAASSHHEH